MSDSLVPSSGDPVSDVDALAAALRADASDLQSFERVLASSIVELLPTELVEVTYERSMKDRLAGRVGEVSQIAISLGELRLELNRARAGLEARVARRVRGVAISSRQVSLDEWSRSLAQALSDHAQQSAQTRDALARLLGTT